jgi:hypothetical protein
VTVREFFRRRPWMWIVIFCVLFVIFDIVLVMIALDGAPKSLLP